jgi:hypothetical protein
MNRNENIDLVAVLAIGHGKNLLLVGIGKTGPPTPDDPNRGVYAAWR